MSNEAEPFRARLIFSFSRPFRSVPFMDTGFCCGSDKFPGAPCSSSMEPLSGPVSPGPPGSFQGELGQIEQNRRAKFYELTARGRKRLREETDGWNRLVAAIASALRGATARGELKQ